MLFQRCHKNSLSHCQAGVQIHKILITVVELIGRYGSKRAVQIVDAFDEVFGEALDGEVFGGLDFALGLFLKVAVFGYLADVAVLRVVINIVWSITFESFPHQRKSYLCLCDFLLRRLELFLGRILCLRFRSWLGGILALAAGASEYHRRPARNCDDMGAATCRDEKGVQGILTAGECADCLAAAWRLRATLCDAILSM
jgi:hypothetical protein